ncbi:MAG TPA: hypothetical protein VHO26_05345 [Propionibacteriaceae bacterium]|nr:hypothetical protein [Propionibacteriaceae bacterium]
MLRRTALVVTCLLGVLVVGSSLAYRAAYGSWWRTPTRIPYCGRTYLAGASGLTLADVRTRELRTALPGDRPYPLVGIGSAPPVVGGRLLAAVTPQAERAKLGVPCAMSVYLRAGQDSYTAYGLSGGP